MEEDPNGGVCNPFFVYLAQNKKNYYNYGISCKLKHCLGFNNLLLYHFNNLFEAGSTIPILIHSLHHLIDLLNSMSFSNIKKNLMEFKT